MDFPKSIWSVDITASVNTLNIAYVSVILPKQEQYKAMQYTSFILCSN